MSDYQTVIYADFISRKEGKVIEAIPIVNRITVNKDIRQFTDSFDFDFLYGLDEKINLHSHDFVEFYFYLNPGQKHQISCGYLEDFVKETSSASHKFQANGRDFLGHILHLPFEIAAPWKTSTLEGFVKYCINDSYVDRYLDYKHISNKVVSIGAYRAALNIQQLSDAKKGPVLQQTADEVYNIVYLDRKGQVVVWGYDNKNDVVINHVLNELNDENDQRFTLRENFSKVFSQVQVFYTSGQSNTDTRTARPPQYNSEPLAANIYQPEIRTFQTATLITTAPGQVELENKIDLYAQSIMRRSNQNLAQVVIQTSLPYYVDSLGSKTPYEVNQLWPIKSESFGIDEYMRLVGINYAQTNSSLEVELLFIKKDSLS